MKILIRRVKTTDISNYLVDLINERFVIETIQEVERDFLEPTEEEKYYPKYYINIDSMEDLFRLRNAVGHDIKTDTCYYTPLCDLVEENNIIICDDYLY